VNLDLELRHGDCEACLGALDIPTDRLFVVFVAPPWGDALSEADGLDLRATTPPAAEVVDLVTTLLPGYRALFATQVYERLQRLPLSELRSRFDWSIVKIYDVDPPGRNHGVLLGTRGWSP
jgi:hypothetical protein